MDKNKKLFPQRLWELIHDEKFNFCLRWSPDGQRVYLNRNDFETYYLKTPDNQFHTQKAISFVRQMNMYGFRKVDDCYYENDNFKKNCPQLLRNMVRRHSNKSFYSPNSDLQTSATVAPITSTTALSHNQSSNRHQHDYHEDRSSLQASPLYQVSRRTSLPQDLGLDSFDRQAQFFSDAGGSINSIGAAMASVNSNAARSPLASTLYHRLAALNFGQQSTAQQLKASQLSQVSGAASASATPDWSLLNQDIDNRSSIGRMTLAHNQASQLQSTRSEVNISMCTQQSLDARQALQQTLVRSMLQHKQPQSPLTLQQNLLASLQQQNPQLLLESLANLSSLSSIGAQHSTNQANVSPMELVVNPSASTTFDNNNGANTFTRIKSNDDYMLTLNPLERQSMAELDIRGSILNTSIDDDELDNDDCTIDFEDNMCNRTSMYSGSSSSNQESSSYPQDSSIDTSNVVLDLAKPSSNRSNGVQKLSKAHESSR